MKKTTNPNRNARRVDSLIERHRKAADAARQILLEGSNPVAWVKSLDEVGAPITEQAREVAAYYHNAFEAFARAIDNANASFDELLLRISRDWKPEEIEAAKNFNPSEE